MTDEFQHQLNFQLVDTVFCLLSILCFNMVILYFMHIGI